MKAKNLDFVLAEVNRLVNNALVTEGIGLPVRMAVTERVRKDVQDEYKYLLRGPKKH